MARKISELDAASTPAGGEDVPVVQGGASKRMALGTHLPFLDATGKIPSAQLPALVGVGDMTKAAYDPANKNGQVLTTADLLDEDNFASDSATKAPSQQSTAAYILSQITAAIAEVYADLADTTDALGSALIGYFNPGGTKFGGATTLKGILDWIWSNGLWSSTAQDAVVATAFLPGDAVALFRDDGTVASMDVGLFKGGNDISFADYSGTTYAITTADKSRTLVSVGAADSTVVLPLQSAQEFAKGEWFRVLWEGVGKPKVVCGNASIVVNGAANGEVEHLARNSFITVENVGPNKWVATSTSGSVVTTDTTPPTIISISPAPGSTILPDQVIEITWSEGIQAGGTGETVTQRADTGSGYADDNVYDMAAALGTDPGEINIIGNKSYIYPPEDRAAGSYAYRMSAGAFKDLASTPNDCAAVASDAVIGPYTVEASGSGIEVVHAEGFTISQGSIVGATHTRTMSASPANGDMVIAFSACVGQILAGIPSGMTAIFDQTASSTPGCFVAQRVEGVTPSDQIGFKTVSNRRQAAGALILRGPGLTVSVGNGTNNATGSTAPKALALAQDTANELRIIAAMVDTKDLDVVSTALEAAGWTSRIEQTTGLASSTEGATLVVATRAQGGADNESIDPPAWALPSAAPWRAFHVGIKQV